MVTRIIAIDGPAASGKGTIAKKLAAQFDFAHMDTGALYRLTGWRVLETGGDPENEADALAAAEYLRDNFSPEMTDIPEIRTDEAGNAASKVGVFSKVRQTLDGLQVNFAKNPPGVKKGAVLDGRDIGTVICPEADVKLYITASTEVRAKRRFEELKNKGENKGDSITILSPTYKDVLRDMKQRDQRDAGRDAAPLKAADDAIIIDTSDLSAEDAYAKALAVVKEKVL